MGYRTGPAGYLSDRMSHGFQKFRERFANRGHQRAKHRSLLSNIYWATLGSVLYALSQWAMITLLARSSNPATLGIYSLALAITGPVFIFFNMQLRTFLSTDVERSYERTTYVLVRSVSTVLAVVVIVSLCLVSSYTSFLYWIIAAVTFSKSIEALSDLCYGEFQLNQRLDLVARSQILRAILSLLLFAVVLIQTQDLLASLCASALAWLIILITHDVKTVFFDLPVAAKKTDQRKAIITSYWNQSRKLAWKCLPAAPAGLFVALETNVPRYFLAEAHDLNQLGLYSALAQIGVAMQFLGVSVFHALVPKLALHASAGDNKGVSRLVLTSVLAGSTAGALAILATYLFGDHLVSFIYGTEYTGHPTAFVLLIAATALSFVWLPLAANVQAAQNLWTRLWLHLGSLLVICFSAYVLTPPHGIEGAAVAMLCGSVTQILGYLTVHLLITRWAKQQARILDND